MAETDNIPSVELENLNIDKTNNFDAWLAIIKNIIYYLKQGNAGIEEINSVIEGAQERNQITSCIDTSKNDANNIIESGTYYVKYGSTANLPSENDYVIYAAKTCENNDNVIVQLALNANITGNTLEKVLFIRRKTGDSNFTNWVQLATNNFVITNFLNKVQENAQTVNSPVTFLKTITENKNLNVKGNIIGNGTINLQESVSPKDGVVFKNGVSYDTEYYFTEEVITNTHKPNNQLYPDLYPEKIWYNENEKVEYIPPLKINYATEICDINGTSRYADFITPEYTVSTYEPNKLTDYSKNYPATATAVSELFKHSEKTYMPKSGGSFTGVVNHKDDIFLRYVDDINSHRTAALRSPDGALNLQCQQITNLISTSKQCELYLEKEDVDSAEYVKKTASYNFSFYKVMWDINATKNLNSGYAFSKNNTNTYIVSYGDIELGTLTLEDDGQYIFIGTDELKRKINSNYKYGFTLYYNVKNEFNEGNPIPVSVRNEYSIKIDKTTSHILSGYVTVNASHYLIVFTKSDFENLKIAKSSILGKESILADGSVISKDSIVDGITYESEETVYGKKICDAKTENGDAIYCTLATGSILKKGTYLAYGSVVNGFPHNYSGGEYLSNDIAIENSQIEDTVLTTGSVIKSGSTIAKNSTVNGTIYTEDEIVSGYALTYDSTLRNGSYIKIGSVISANSIINPDFVDTKSYGSYGINITEDSILTKGSTIIAGSYIPDGCIINGTTVINGGNISASIILTADSKLIEGSFIKDSSVINAGSTINGITYTSKFTVKNPYNYIGIVKLSTVLPKMYISTYDNIRDKYERWIEYSYDGPEEYDYTYYNEKLTSIINRLFTTDAQKEAIIEDIPRIIQPNQTELEYPAISDLQSTPYNGKYTAISTAKNNPQSVYDEYVYIASTDKRISLDRIELSVGNKNFVIYSSNNEMITLNPTTDIFKYSNFVVRKSGSIYKIAFDYVLAKPLNQYPADTDVFSEDFSFNFYANDMVLPFATGNYTISLDSWHQMNAACTIGARTRTGITKEGELGDPLYDLGCVEFGEDYTAIRVRKKNVTTFQNIKNDIAVVLKRNAFMPEYIVYVESEKDKPYVIGKNKSGMITLGTSDSKFDSLFINSAAIETSDKTKKTAIRDIPDKLIEAWKNVKWVTYKLKDSVEKKGKNARIHTGVIAQDLEKTLSGIDLEKYGFFCKDSLEDEYDTQYVTIPKHIDEFGIEREERIEERKILKSEKGEQYSLRYQEMQAIENMYLRKEIEMLKKEIEKLKYQKDK